MVKWLIGWYMGRALARWYSAMNVLCDDTNDRVSMLAGELGSTVEAQLFGAGEGLGAIIITPTEDNEGYDIVVHTDEDYVEEDA